MEKIVSSAYVPSQSERQITLAHGDFLKLSGDGIFATLQGEGVTAGSPAVFLRLQNCNLSCGNNNIGWRCDTWYTWDKSTPEYWSETANIPVEEVAQSIYKTWAKSFGAEDSPRLIVTGGEPLLQQQKITQLFDMLPGWLFEIETNGTIQPLNQLKSSQINCSPKLASSGNSLVSRYRPNVLKNITTFPNHWFKFVVTGDEDIQEINAIVEDIGIEPSRVLLMSEGSDAKVLIQSDKKLKRVALSLGYSLTARNHILWFGDKRAT